MQYNKIKPNKTKNIYNFEDKKSGAMVGIDMNNVKRKRRMYPAAIVLCICFFAVVLSGCADNGGKKASGAVSDDSPALQTLELKGICEGGEQDQYIVADLTFDKNISYSDKLAEQIRVVIGGQRVKEDSLSLSAPGEDCLELKIHVNQVNDGMLEITNAPGCSALTALTDDSGKNCVGSLNIKKLVPSGAAISCVSSDGSEALYQVDSIVTHRSIIWLRLFDGEDAVIPDNTNTTDVMENAAAVHQHEFLWATPESTAADMAETINSFYGSGYTASAEGNQLTIKRKDSAAAGTRGTSDGGGENTGIRLEIYEGE